jgi:hypothetical protein
MVCPIGHRLAFWIMAMIAVLLAIMVAYYLVSPYVELPETDLRAWGMLFVFFLLVVIGQVVTRAHSAARSFLFLPESLPLTSGDLSCSLPLRC